MQIKFIHFIKNENCFHQEVFCMMEKLELPRLYAVKILAKAIYFFTFYFKLSFLVGQYCFKTTIIIS